MVEKVEIQERGINMAVDQETENGEDMSALAGKYLTFKLAGEEYGIEILKIREIIGLMDITDVPRMPGYVRGVINLRGKVIPVVDLRTRFGMMSTEDTDETCIIVVDATQDGESSQTGILVDTVSEVLDVAGGQIEKTSAFGAAMDTKFIMGMAKIDGDIKILLDIVAALS